MPPRHACLDCSIERQIRVADHDLILLRVHALPLEMYASDLPDGDQARVPCTPGELATAPRSWPARFSTTMPTWWLPDAGVTSHRTRRFAARPADQAWFSRLGRR